MFFRGVGIELSKIFVEITELCAISFSVLQRSPSSFTRSPAAGRYGYRYFPAQCATVSDSNILRRQRVNVVMVQPQQLAVLNALADLLTAFRVKYLIILHE